MSPAHMIERAASHCKNCKDVVPVPLSGYYATRLIYCNEIADGEGTANCNTNDNFFRIFLLKLQKEWRIFPEKR